MKALKGAIPEPVAIIMMGRERVAGSLNLDFLNWHSNLAFFCETTSSGHLCPLYEGSPLWDAELRRSHLANR